MSDAPDRPSDLADHPGRPRGRDELDPELLVLPRPRPRIGPLLSLSVLVLCAYFLVRLRGDLVFTHQGDDPVEVKSVAGALAAGVDSYIEIQAVPDRAAILRVYASEAREGHRLAPVVGSGDRLWILLPGSHWGTPPVYSERVRGRVKRLGDLPFYDALVAELARTQQPRAIEPRAALAALAASPAGPERLEVPAVGGDSVVITADKPVTVVERAVGEVRVTGFATERHPDEAAWRAALAAAGLLAPGAPLEQKSDSTWSFRVAAPDGIDSVAAKLVAARLFAARAEAIGRTHRRALSDLRVQGGDLLLAAAPGQEPERVRTDGITAMLVEVPHQAPADARVLVTTDRPGDYHHVIWLCLVLGLLAILFTWALWRGLKPALKGSSEEPPT